MDPPLSQERLAGLIGTDRRHVIRLEHGLARGGHNPDWKTRSKLAEVLGLPEEFFIDEHTRRPGKGRRR